MNTYFHNSTNYEYHWLLITDKIIVCFNSLCVNCEINPGGCKLNMATYVRSDHVKPTLFKNNLYLGTNKS